MIILPPRTLYELAPDIQPLTTLTSRVVTRSLCGLALCFDGTTAKTSCGRGFGEFVARRRGRGGGWEGGGYDGVVAVCRHPEWMKSGVECLATREDCVCSPVNADDRLGILSTFHELLPIVFPPGPVPEMPSRGRRADHAIGQRSRVGGGVGGGGGGGGDLRRLEHQEDARNSVGHHPRDVHTRNVVKRRRLYKYFHPSNLVQM